MKILKIDAKKVYDWFLKKHYAHRIPSISYCFGLFDNELLIGVVSYGTPPSPPLRRGIAGDQWKENILELNRLVLNDDSPKNSASFLVGNTLKMLPKPSIVVSFADIGQNHIGYVYQATNFIYTGLSAKRTDWKVKGMEELHGMTIGDMSRGHKNRAEYMRERFGDDFYLEERGRKHRYIFIVASKHDKKKILQDLKYPILPYPKGDNVNYDASCLIEQQFTYNLYEELK